MRPTTDKQFISAARILANEHIDRFARMGMSPDETANLFGAAMLEVLAHQLGPYGAVDRLRSMADVAEKQLIDPSFRDRRSDGDDVH